MKIFKRISLGFVVLLILGSVVSAIGGQIPSRSTLKAKRVTRAVAKLPLGSSKSQVAAYLKSEALEYSYVGDKEGMDFTSAVSRNGYSSANLSGYTVAIIRNTSGGFLTSGDVQYFFFFDKKGGLVKATAQEVFTGL